MENKPFIAIICGEDERVKKEVASKIMNGRAEEFIVFSNPENSCHPKIQSMSAERNAKYTAECNWKVILMTNSFHYLEAFLFYLKKYEAYGNIHFYLVENGKVLESDNAHDLMKNLSQPAFDLANERLAYELREEDFSDDDEED